MLHGVAKTSASAQCIETSSRKDVAGARGVLRDRRGRRHLDALCLKSNNHRSRPLCDDTCAQAFST